MMTDYTDLISRLEKPLMAGNFLIGDPDREPAAKAIRQLKAERELDEQRVADLMAQVGELSAERDDYKQALDELGVTPAEARKSAERSRAKDDLITNLTAERDRYKNHYEFAAATTEAVIAERDAAFAMSKCECESNEACKNLVALHDEVERLKQERDAALEELKKYQEQLPRVWQEINRGQAENDALKSALREALEQLDAIRLAVEPYDDIKPRDWKSDRANLRDAHQCAKEAIATINEALK